MKAFFLFSGIKISLLKKDKDKSELECSVLNFEGPKVFLSVRDKVENVGNFEEPGFHIETFPHVELRKAEKINIYLSEERWEQLTTKIDPEAKGGYFESRSPYDRVSFHYWDKKML